MNNNIEELLRARAHAAELENTIRDANKARVLAFKEEFKTLREKYKDVKVETVYCGPSDMSVVARIKNPVGLSHEEVDLF